MTGNKNTSSEAGGQSRPAWIVAITATAGLLAALIIAILRLGKPRRSPIPPQSYPIMPFAGSAASAAHPPAPITALSGQPAPALTGGARPTATPRWSLTTKYIVGVGLFLSIMLLIYISRGSLSMVIFAALIAFVVRPLIGWFQRRFKLKRGASTGVTYLLVIVLLVTLPLLLIPPIIDGINYILSIDFQTVVQNLDIWLQEAAVQVQSMPIAGAIFGPLLESLSLAIQNFSSTTTPASAEQVTVANLTNQIGQVVGILVNVLGPLISAAVSIVFMLLISLHMSLSIESLQKSYPRLIPEAYRPEISNLIERIVNVWSSFLRGQLSLMAVMGILTFLLNWLLGTPYPLFLGFLAGMLEIIPSLGPVLATIPAVLFALINGSTRFAIDPLVFALIVIAGYVLLSAIENQILVPKILGDAVSLPPLVVLLGVVIGGSLFGILGIFLATPVISTGKEIYAYLYDKILEPPPVEKPPDEKPGLLASIRNRLSSVRWPKLRQDKPADTMPDIEPVKNSE